MTTKRSEAKLTVTVRVALVRALLALGPGAEGAAPRAGCVDVAPAMAR